MTDKSLVKNQSFGTIYTVHFTGIASLACGHYFLIHIVEPEASTITLSPPPATRSLALLVFYCSSSMSARLMLLRS